MKRLAAALVAALLLGAAGDPGFTARETEWRAQREAELRADDGWLAVAGLFWLDEGVSRFGTAPDNEIVFPAGSTAAVAGTIERRGARVTLRALPGIPLLDGGKPVTVKEMRADADLVSLGRLRMTVVFRDDRYALRLRDLERPERKTFAGLTWYPIDPAYAVTARFEAYATPRTLQVPNVLNHTVPMANPGRVLFRLPGQKRELSLDAVLDAPGATELFFIFDDATSGRTTYGGGRFLYSDLPVDGRVVLNFNRAHSAPCAFTEFATCPLPPPQNRLPVAVEAGEKAPHQH